MSLDKAIEHGKEYRKPFRKSKAFDCSCRNHGSCGWCRSNREINKTKHRHKASDHMKDYAKGEEQ